MKVSAGRVLRRQLIGGLDRFRQSSEKVRQAGVGNDDAVGFTTAIFDDPHETAPWVFLEPEHEHLALDLNLLGMERLFIHRRAWHRVVRGKLWAAGLEGRSLEIITPPTILAKTVAVISKVARPVILS